METVTWSKCLICLVCKGWAPLILFIGFTRLHKGRCTALLGDLLITTPSNTTSRLAGENVDMMSEHMPLESFQRIYIVDLCKSLCEVARKKVRDKGWKNVVVVEGDACTFVPPEGKAQLITFSYSLSSEWPHLVPPDWVATAHASSSVCSATVPGSSSSLRYFQAFEKLCSRLPGHCVCLSFQAPTQQPTLCKQ